MREDLAGRWRVSWRSNPLLQRLAGPAARLSAAVVLVTGMTSGFAARRRRDGDGGEKDKGDKNDKNNSDGGRKRDGDKDGGNDRDRERERDGDGGRDREGRRERERERDDETRAEREERRQREERRADSDEVDAEANQVSKRQRNQDDEPTDQAGDDGPNRAGNAGSEFFDSPLATKARRRANDFENQERGEEDEDGIFVDVDPLGESIYETEAISYTTGPEGIEILTTNITYFAAPTPTPTPFPRLVLPERAEIELGDAFVAPTPTATADTAAPVDSGVPVEPVPTQPPPVDTDGGDNGMDFLS